MYDFDLNTPEGMEMAARWVRNMLDLIKDHGQWGIPRSLTIYEFDKVAMTATRLVGPGDLPTERVLIHMGYTVVTDYPKETTT